MLQVVESHRRIKRQTLLLQMDQLDPGTDEQVQNELVDPAVMGEWVPDSHVRQLRRNFWIGVAIVLVLAVILILTHTSPSSAIREISP